jgi:hypothetical protein
MISLLMWSGFPLLFPSPSKGEDEGEGPYSARASRAIQDSESFLLSNPVPLPAREGVRG